MSNMTDGKKAGIGVGAAVGILALAAMVVWVLICTQTQSRDLALPQRRDKQRAEGTYEMEV